MDTASDSAVEHSLEGGAFLFLEGKVGILPKTTSDIFPKDTSGEWGLPDTS